MSHTALLVIFLYLLCYCDVRLVACPIAVREYHFIYIDMGSLGCPPASLSDAAWLQQHQPKYLSSTAPGQWVRLSQHHKSGFLRFYPVVFQVKWSRTWPIWLYTIAYCQYLPETFMCYGSKIDAGSCGKLFGQHWKTTMFVGPDQVWKFNKHQ